MRSLCKHQSENAVTQTSSAHPLHPASFSAACKGSYASVVAVGLHSFSISSKDLFLVSGSSRQAQIAWSNAIAARKPKTEALPTLLNAAGKKRTTSALATHWVRTGTVIAVPRMSFGNISGTTVQKTGPMQDSKKAR